MLKSPLLLLVLWTVTAVQAFQPMRIASSSSSLSPLFMTTKEVDTKQDIRVGVIGMGRIGLVHLEAITKAPGVRPVIVSNPTVSKAEAGAFVGVFIENSLVSR
jgi:threonine dehydrogenase-like Zn-dependent dehydrogenase